MPVQVISQDERESFEFEGGTFYYRRPPLKMRKKWTNECTNRYSVTDYYGIIEKAVPYCLLGWDDGAVIDSDDKPVKFSVEIAMMLPESFFMKLGDVLGLSNPESNEDERKNLSDTSN